MKQKTKNSHYIARHLTKPWEFGERQLWYYDLDTDSFGEQSSKSLYTTDEPWDQSVEDFLNEYLETPLSQFLARFGKDRKAMPTQSELRAMKLTVLLQPNRCDDSIAEIAQKDESYIDTLVMAADKIYSFVHVQLEQESLFFPDHGLIAIPFVGADMAFAVPLHPSYFTAAVRNPASLPLKHIKLFRQDPELLTALSMGLDTCRRFVIPSSARAMNDEVKMREEIKRGRRFGASVTKAMLEANAAAAQSFARL